MNGLESRILDAVYAAQDTIDSHVLVSIRYPGHHCFSRDVKTITKSIRLIHKEAIGVKEMAKAVPRYKSRWTRTWSKVVEISGRGSKKNVKERSSNTLKDQPMQALNTENDFVVGLKDIMNPIMDKLIGKRSNLRIVSITGMGGIGKSTLAKTIYNNSLILESFQVRGWLMVSQEVNLQKLLFRLLLELGVPLDENGEENLEYSQLGEKLYKHLLGRRYLIVVDDLWNLETWNKIKLFLPNCNDGCGVIVTTRLSNLASDIGSSYIHQMDILNQELSWSLLERKVFDREHCPCGLERIGKKIAVNCKGLPLLIIVIGSLLAKSVDREHWEFIAADIGTSTVNTEDHMSCLKVLSTSYSHLPVHLKPCFLYLGVYPADHEIRVSRLIKLWVAEGILKPHSTKTLEEVAYGYLNDLIDRNLLFVTKFGYTGYVKRCRIHDLLRDMCLREAERERFLCVIDKHRTEISQILRGHCRVAVHDSLLKNEESAHEVYRALESSLLLRTLVCSFQSSSESDSFHSNSESDSSLTFESKLIRVWGIHGNHPPNYSVRLGNSRYIDFGCTSDASYYYSAMIRFWNLQTVALINTSHKVVSMPSGMWKMLQLRHVMVNCFYIDGSGAAELDGDRDSVVLVNLQTCFEIIDLKCTEAVIRKIPNIKKLKVRYQDDEMIPFFHLKNLSLLQNLETLCCTSLLDGHNTLDVLDFEFPRSLKKLTLSRCRMGWEDVGKKIGSLPHLKQLKLFRCCGRGVWNLVEGQFPSLKCLELVKSNLVCWEADSSHFRRLEHLILRNIYTLREIPCGIGDIPTLQRIDVISCSNAVVASAEMIQEEQINLGNDDLSVFAFSKDMNSLLRV